MRSGFGRQRRHRSGGQRDLCGVGLGRGRGGVGDQGGVCDEAGGTVSKGEVCGDGDVYGGRAGGGVLGAELTRRACTIFLGVATRGSGALTCAIVGGAAGGYAGGNLGGDGGKFLGGKVIEMEGDLILQPEVA